MAYIPNAIYFIVVFAQFLEVDCIRVVVVDHVETDQGIVVAYLFQNFLAHILELRVDQVSFMGFVEVIENSLERKFVLLNHLEKSLKKFKQLVFDLGTKLLCYYWTFRGREFDFT